MRYIELLINCKMISFLELNIYDELDISELSKHHNASAVSVSIENLKYNDKFNNIEYLRITSGPAERDNWNYVYNLSNLKALILEYEETDNFSEYSVDCSKLNGVEYIFSRSSFNLKNINASSTLKTLIVGNWYQPDMSLFQLSKIDALQVCRGKCKSLAGIENLQALKILSLSGLQIEKTELVASLPKLRFLELEACNKIKDINQLYDLKSLEYIILVCNIRVNNLDFINKMKKLKRVILDIRVEDGDLKPLQRLDRAVILKKYKNYNLSDKDMPYSKEPYKINDIPEWRNYLNGRRNL